MKYILRAHGPHGNHKNDWNFCNELEPVGAHSLVCCNKKTCGCHRSFIGLATACGTTRAIVSEVSEGEFLALLTELYQERYRAWRSTDIAQQATSAFADLTIRLVSYQPGDILRVRMLDSGFRLDRTESDQQFPQNESPRPFHA